MGELAYNDALAQLEALGNQTFKKKKKKQTKPAPKSVTEKPNIMKGIGVQGPAPKTTFERIADKPLPTSTQDFRVSKVREPIIDPINPHDFTPTPEQLKYAEIDQDFAKNQPVLSRIGYEMVKPREVKEISTTRLGDQFSTQYGQTATKQDIDVDQVLKAKGLPTSRELRQQGIDPEFYAKYPKFAAVLYKQLVPQETVDKFNESPVGGFLSRIQNTGAELVTGQPQGTYNYGKPEPTTGNKVVDAIADLVGVAGGFAAPSGVASMAMAPSRMMGNIPQVAGTAAKAGRFAKPAERAISGLTGGAMFGATQGIVEGGDAGDIAKTAAEDALIFGALEVGLPYFGEAVKRFAQKTGKAIEEAGIRFSSRRAGTAIQPLEDFRIVNKKLPEQLMADGWVEHKPGSGIWKKYDTTTGELTDQYYEIVTVRAYDPVTRKQTLEVKPKYEVWREEQRAGVTAKPEPVSDVPVRDATPQQTGLAISGKTETPRTPLGDLVRTPTVAQPPENVAMAPDAIGDLGRVKPAKVAKVEAEAETYPIGMGLVDSAGEPSVVTGRYNGKYLINHVDTPTEVNSQIVTKQELDELMSKQDDIKKRVADNEAFREKQEKVQEEERQRKEEAESIGDFYADKAPMQRQKAKNALNKTLRHNGKVMTRKEYVRQAIEEGRRIEKKELVNQNAVSKAQEELTSTKTIDSGWAKRERELRAIIENPPTKTEHRIYNSDGSYNVITKTEYEYYNHLSGKKPAGKVAPKEEATVKQPKAEPAEEVAEVKLVTEEVAKPKPKKQQPKAKEPVGEIRRGKVGGRAGAGEVLLTATGRETTPFPRFKRDPETKKTTPRNIDKKADKWLIDNALEEARARGDRFNIRYFENMDLKNLSESDRDAAELYLFGDEVHEVVPSILREPSKVTEPKQPAKPTDGLGVTKKSPKPKKEADVLEGVGKPKQEPTEAYKKASSFISRISKGEPTTLDEVKAEVEHIFANDEAITAELRGMTNKELDKLLPWTQRGRYKKKDELVDAVADNLLTRMYYEVSGSNSLTTSFDGIGGWRDNVKQQIQGAIDKHTPETWDNLQANTKKEYDKALAERKTRLEGVKTPKTLDDFRTASQLRKLTPEKRDTYEDLLARENKSSRLQKKQMDAERKADKASAVLEGDRFTITKDKHTKTGEDVWIVKLNERVEAEEWKAINSSMKSLGGSWWRGNQGWNFKTDPTEKLDIGKKIEAKQESNVSKLRKVADNMQKDIDDRLAPRLANTPKRAKQAASMAEDAERLQVLQQTIRNLADGIESGEVELLTNIDAKIQIETLDRVLHLAQRERISELNLTYNERLAEQGKPYTVEDIRYAKFPAEEVHVNTINSIIGDINGKKGYMQIAARFKKAVANAENDYVKITGRLREDLEKVARANLTKGMLIEDLMQERKRLERMGIESEGELRAYLREYIKYRGEVKIDPNKAIREKERALIGTKIEGYFPTPKPIVDKMLDAAEISEGMDVLEPSAGKGNIADAIGKPDVIEIVPDLREILTDKGHNLVASDFTEYTGKQYDRIVMNPPFEKGQDIDHVRHAYELLKPGGRIVAIMSEGPFFRGDKKATAFREWLDEVGYSEKLPEGSFKNSERSTGVNTRMVVIDKPAEVKQAKQPQDTADVKGFTGEREMQSGANKEKILYTPNYTDDKHLEKVKKAMQKHGSPKVDIVEVYDGVYVALEGSHRIRAAAELGIPVEYTEVDPDAPLEHDDLVGWDGEITNKEMAEAKLELGETEEFDITNDIPVLLSDRYGEVESEAIKDDQAKQATKEPTNPLDGLGVQGFSGKKEMKPSEPTQTEPVRKKDIIDFLSEKLDIPVRVGRYNKRGAKGIFKVKPEVVRTKLAEDIEVTAHEIGHYLDKKLGLSDMPFEEEMAKLAHGFEGDAREEGTAQFINYYLTNPEKAKRLAPGYYEAFQDKMKENPDIAEILETAQGQIKTWLEQPAKARILGSLSIGETQAKKPMSVDRVVTAWFDQLRPIDTYVQEITKGEKIPEAENPYIKARLANGWTGKAEAYLMFGQFDKDLEVVGPSLKEILKSAGDLDNFRTVIVAKRVIELSNRGIETGIEPSDAKRAIREIRDEIGDAGLKKILEAQKELLKFQDYTLDLLVDAGRISPETKAKMREMNKDYVPFYRVFDDSVATAKFTGKKFANLTSPIKKIKGSGRTIIDPLESIINNTFMYTSLAERNKVGRAIVELAEKFEGSGKWVEEIPPDMYATEFSLNEIKRVLTEAGVDTQGVSLEQMARIFRPSSFISGKDNVVTVFRDGEMKLYQLHPDLYRATLFLDEISTGIIEKILAAPARTLRAGATGLNLEFAVRNPIRDQWSAAINSHYGYVPGVDLIRGLAHMLKKDDVYQKFYAAGGAHGNLVSGDRKYNQTMLRKLLRGDDFKGQLKNILLHPVDILRAISEIGETAPRVQEVARGLKSDDSIEKVIMSARELSLDFAKGGNVSKELNRVIAFFNAQALDLHRVQQRFKEDPKRAYGKSIALITVPSIILYGINRDNPWWQEKKRWEKDIFWLVPKSAKQNEKNFYRIPKPFTLGILFGTLPERFLEYADTQDRKAFDDLWETIKNNLLFDAVPDKDFMGFPPGLIPTAMLPIIEGFANKSSFTGYDIVPQSEQSLAPEEQYNVYTSETAKVIGKAMGVSPRKVDSMVYGYTAGVGRTVVGGLDKILHAAGVGEDLKPDRGALDAPIIKSFMSKSGATTGSAETIDRFYELYNETETIYRTTKKKYERGERYTLTKDEIAKLQSLDALRSVNGYLRNMRKAEKQVLESTKITPKQKAKAIEALNIEEVNYVRKAFGMEPLK